MMLTSFDLLIRWKGVPGSLESNIILPDNYNETAVYVVTLKKHRCV